MGDRDVEGPDSERLLPRSFRVAELVRRLPQLTAGEILPHRRDHSALTSVKPVLPRSFQVAELVPATSLAKVSALVSSGRVGPASSPADCGGNLATQRRP